MADEPGMHDDFVLIDQSHFRQCERECHASREKSLTRLLLELLNRGSLITTHELRVPINPVQCARHDVLLLRVDRPGERFHPIRSLSGWRRVSPRCFHHFVRHPSKEQSISPLDALRRTTMQLFVRDSFTMIATSVERDVDRISKWSHVLLTAARPEPPSHSTISQSRPSLTRSRHSEYR